jgi:hypothetical protein
LPGLDADNYQVNWPNFTYIIRSFCGIDSEVAIQAIDSQTARLHGVQVFAARNESDILACLGKSPAEVSPNATSPKDCYSHVSLPEIIFAACKEQLTLSTNQLKELRNPKAKRGDFSLCRESF